MNEDIMLICYQISNSDELQITLLNSNISVAQVKAQQNAKISILQHNPAFILLDIDMEGSVKFLQDLSTCIILDPPPYILIATAFPEKYNRAAVFNLGADACLEKPISPQELIAVIHSVLRREHKIMRFQTSSKDFCIKHQDLKIYPLSHTVTMREKLVSLTPKEYEILHLLAKRAGTVLRKEEIYKEVWKEQHECAAIRVTDNIHSLRQKLGLDSKNSDYIQTVHSIGYRFAKLE